jgi:hypothetical protein
MLQKTRSKKKNLKKDKRTEDEKKAKLGSKYMPAASSMF